MQTFSWPVRVYWEDTDAGGVVYHSQYLNFFERARTEWLRSIGVEQSLLRATAGIVFVVHSMQLEFLSPARLDDELQVGVTLEKLGAATMLLQQDMQRHSDGKRIARATLKVACLDAREFTPVRIPEKIRMEIQHGT